MAKTIAMQTASTAWQTNAAFAWFQDALPCLFVGGCIR